MKKYLVIVLLCFQVSVASAGTGVFKGDLTELQAKYDRVTADLEEDKRRMDMYIYEMKRAKDQSEKFKNHVESFERTVQAHLKQMASCKVMKVQYLKMAEVELPTPEDIKMQEDALESCARRAERNTVHQLDITDFFKNIEEEIKRMQNSAKFAGPAVDGLQTSIDTLMAQKEYWLERIREITGDDSSTAPNI